MISVKTLALGCIAILFSSHPVFSQSSRKIAFRTLCLEQVKGLESVVVPGENPDKPQKCQLYTDVSPVVEGAFPNAEAAFYIEKGVGSDGKPIRELVGKTSLGKSERQLFLFVPNEGKTGYSVRAFDDDVKSFGMGFVRVINVAPVPIRFELSGEITPQIPAGKFAQFAHSKKVNDYNMYPVVVQFLSGSGEWVNAQSVTWKATDRRRDIVITSVDPRSKQPTVQTFADFPPWMEAPVTPLKP